MPRLIPLFALLFAGLVAAQSPVPGRPGFFEIDDMIVPADAISGDLSNWTPSFWPNAMVPFVFDTGVSQNQQNLFRKAMAEIEATSGVRFVPYSAGLPVLIIRRTTSTACPDTCSSADLGYTGFPQYVNVGNNHWGNKIVLIHELFHTLGFTHEQQRIDRNQYVTINTPFISQTRCDGPCNHNFSIAGISIPQTPYDFLSIMHYDQYAFSICPPSCNATNPLPTISAKPGYTQFQNQMGNRTYVTHHDAAGLATVYGAPPAPVITSLSTTSLVAGSGSFTLTVNGNFFFEGSPNASGVQGTEIWVGGQALTTTYIDQNQVQATVPFSLLTAPGNLNVAVLNDQQSAGGWSNGFVLTVTSPPCPSQNDRIGYAVASLGDVNGDECDDYVVGAPGLNGGNGAAICYSGKTGAILWSINGGTGYEMGKAVANAGDVNGDGSNDAIIGAPSYATFRGLIRIVNGSNGSVIRTTTGGGTNWEFGWAVGNAGDVNGDGVPDQIIGSPAYNGGAGRVNVRSGSNGGLLFTALGSAAGNRLGHAVSGGLDIGGDGVPDFCAGAPNNDENGSESGKMYCWSGSSGGLLFTRTGDGAYDYFGRDVAIIPSTQGSSNAEIAVGAPEWGSIFGASPGPGYVKLYRRSGAFVITYPEIGSFTGQVNGDRYGETVAAAGDLNDDGYMDLLIGATEGGIGAQPNTGSGYVEVLSGVDQTPLWFRRQGVTGDDYGWAAAAAGDTDGDGVRDLIVGAPFGDVPCGNAGSYFIHRPIIAPEHRKIMITELECGEPDGLEITNFGTSARFLTGWRVVWHNGLFRYESTPFPSTMIDVGESIVVRESGTPYAEMPSGTQDLVVLPSLFTTSGNFSVALVNATGMVVDEVRVEAVNGGSICPSLGGTFRGLALRHQSGPVFTSSRLERVWGLDSNGGYDWSAETDRSMGLENRTSRLLRGFDPISIPSVRLNEVSDAPDFVELYNLSGFINLAGWYLLCSGQQNLAHVKHPLWAATRVLPPGGYAVIGDTAAPPAETPTGIPYLYLAGSGSGNLPLSTREFSLGLYDRYGRLVDYVRASGHDDEVAHNHPRPPRSWQDFTDCAPQRGAPNVIGRNFLSTDHNVGDDWRSMPTRTMGTVNGGQSNFIPDPNPGLDVRLNATRLGGGMTLILNGGPSRAGQLWSFAFSAGHLWGTGPILGLGADAVNNYLLLATTPPWSGTLDGRGSARLDIPGGLFPSGVESDNIFLLQDPATGTIDLFSHILMWDS